MRGWLTVPAIILSFLLLNSTTLFADTIIWEGGTGNWNDTSFWDSGVLPGSSDDIFIDGGKTGIDSVVNVNVDANVGNLTIDAGDELNINNTNTLTIHGATVLNNGTLSLNSLGSLTSLRLANDVNLEGSGTIVLGDSSNNRIQGTSGSATTEILTNTENHTIQGGGFLGTTSSTGRMGIVNRGLINANLGTPLTVYFNTADAVNSGILQASDQGSLIIHIAGTTLDNSGGTIQALDQSNVDIRIGRSIGGTLSTAGTGVITLSNGATLDSVANTGNVHIMNGQNGALAGTIINQGTLLLNSLGSLTTLSLAGDVVLEGSGAILLSDNGNNRIQGTSGTGTTEILTNTANHTIGGSGTIGTTTSGGRLGLINQGLIDANQSTALTLELDTAEGIARINTGILQASNGGTLNFQGGALDNTGGLIQALGGSLVNLRGERVTSGLLDSTGTGVIALDGATLDTLTSTGQILVDNTRTGTLAGTITNQGIISLNSLGSLTSLRLENDVTLEGSGAMLLSDNGNNRIQGTSPLGTTEILTNTENHSIRGSGTIGTTTSGNRLGLINQGLIDANQSAALTLELDTAVGVTRTNTGILQASNGGTLNIQGGALDNTGGLVQALEGSIVNLRGDRVLSGLLATTGTGVIALDGTTLDSLTNTGRILIDNNRTGTLAGTITNQDTISLNSLGSLTTLRLENDVTLEGSGAMLLSDNGNNRIQGTSPFGTTEVLTNTASHSIRGSGTIGTATSGSRLGLLNQGLIDANQNNRLVITPMDAVVHQDSGANMLNTGTLRASGTGGMELTQGNILNLGTVEALNNSTITYATSATTLDNNAGVLESGTWRVVSTGDGATITIRGAAISQIGENAEVALSGAGSVFQVASTALESSLTNNSGILRILDNRGYTTSNDLTNSGLLQLGGGTLNTNSLTSTGTLTGYGTVIPRAINSGLIEATGGTLAITGGIQGGTVTIQPGGSLDLSSATQASSADFLIHQGTAFDSLNLGGSDFIVSKDYNNANFGTGNAFDHRANVSGGGQLIGENAAMTITGAVTSAGANTVTLDLGNVRGGTSTTVNYQVANSGSGADIRGAVQTAGTGNLTDTRLSGSGVTAGNFGPIVAAANSSDLSVTFAATSGGFLDGQTIGVVSNFENVAGQTIQITGMASALAQGSATPAGPIELGNFRVGADEPTQNFNVENITSGPGAEQLGIGSAETTGNFTVTNNLGAGLIAGGASQADALSAAVSSGVAGVNTGALNIQYTTDGTNIDSSFTAIDANSQSIELNALGYQVAQPTLAFNDVSFANQRVGASAYTQNVGITNTSDAPDGFQESLNASFTGTTGSAVATGSVNQLTQGSSDSGSLVVSLDTSTAGALSGEATLGLVSTGVGTSGLGDLALGGQEITISGNVYQVAQGSLNSPSFDFGVVQVGESVSQNLSISNIATGATGFVEDLNVSFGDTNGTGSNLIIGSGSISGLLAGATDTSGMLVSVNTSSAGSVDGAIALNYFSAGAVNGVSNGLGILAVGSDSFGVIGTIETTGTVVDQAIPVINTTQPIVLGNVREGAVSPTALVSVTNQTTGNDQAGLNAAITGNGPVTANGSFNMLLPGDIDATSLQVGMNTATAGAIDGTATIAFVSDAGNHGGGQLTLDSQDVQVTGAVYRLAEGVANPDPVNFGNLRVGSAASQTLTITNLATNDGFSELLNAAFTAVDGHATHNNGSVVLLGAGESNVTGMNAQLDTSVAGARSGTVTLGFESDGTGTTGEVAIGVGSQTVALSANVFNMAAGSASPDPVVIANQRVGSTESKTLTVSNTAATGAFTEGLNANFSSNTGNAVNNDGSISLLAGGASDNATMSVGVDTSVAGARTGTVTLNFATDGTGTSGLAMENVGSQTITVSGDVYQVAQGSLNTTSLNFGVVQVGESVSQNLSISNTASGAAGFVEDLNASFGDTSGTGSNLITGSGSISGLLAGATNSSNMLVSVNTGSAGTVNGAIAINYFSAGAVGGVSNGLGVLAIGSQDFGVIGTIETTGIVVDQANPVINTVQPILLGNVRQGSVSPSSFVSVTNQATGNDQAALNATITGNAPITAGGSFYLLDPGATNDTSLQVGMNTVTAGAIDGTATIAFVSDAGNHGGGQLTLASQDITVQGAVYRLANPNLDTTDVTLAARRGDVAPSAGIGVTNMSSDAYTEGLNAAMGTVTSGFSAAGSLTNLAAGASDNSNLQVTLDTATAGSFAGNAQVDFMSTGTGTTGAEDISIGSGTVALAGRVYEAAQAQLNTNTIDFGIVHVGEVVSTQEVSVSNVAPDAGLNDTLAAGFAGLSAGPFSGIGSVSGLGAGQMDNVSLGILLDTSTAGYYSNIGDYVYFVSQNPDMADLDLGLQGLSLSAQVNNYANPVFSLLSGPGSLDRVDNTFTLDLGTLINDGSPVIIGLGLFNDVAGPTDLLDGSFDVSDVSVFSLLDSMDPFSDLDAGQGVSFSIEFDPTTLLGSYSELVSVSARGHNASGYEQFYTLDLRLVAAVSDGAPVPEPGTFVLLMAGILVLVFARRKGIIR